MARCSYVEFTVTKPGGRGAEPLRERREVPLARVSSADHGSHFRCQRETAREVEIASATYLLARSVISARPMWKGRDLFAIGTRRRCVVIRGKGG